MSTVAPAIVEVMDTEDTQSEESVQSNDKDESEWAPNEERTKAHAFIVELFDKVLMDDPIDKVSELAFGNVFEQIGVHGIEQLIERTKYHRASEINDFAMKYLVKSMSRPSKDKVEWVLGCRDPKSKPFSWDKAFVVAKLANRDEITGALFQDGTDFIGHPKSYEDACNDYKVYINKGWKPMTIGDLKKTSGMTTIDDSTIIGLREQKTTLTPMYGIGIGSAILLAIVCIVGAEWFTRYQGERTLLPEDIALRPFFRQLFRSLAATLGCCE